MKTFSFTGDVKQCRSEMENFVLTELELASPKTSHFFMVAEHLATAFLARDKVYAITLSVDLEKLSLSFEAKEQ